MTIDKEGNEIKGAWWRSMGPAFDDPKSPYRPDFLVVIPYTDKQKEQWRKILDLKNQLSATDHWDNKYIEGEYTEEEWAEKKAQRMAWRNAIREIEKDFVEPTMTLEEMREAERKAMKHINTEEENGQYIFGN